MQDEVLRLLSQRRGHFVLESGHHGELWLDLERLFLRPERLEGPAGELTQRLARHEVDVVCGPLVEGAFVGLLVASRLRVPFAYSEPVPDKAGDGLFRVAYKIPKTLRGELRGKRVAVVNDVINAGSAVKGTLDDLDACRAEVAAIGTLVVLGYRASRLAEQRGIPLETLAAMPSRIWEPEACPLCARGVPLTSPTD